MIPKYDQFEVPILDILSKQPTSIFQPKDLHASLASLFHVTDEEKAELYPTIAKSIFADRVSWAFSYLYNSGLIDRPSRGHYQINEHGLKILEKKSPLEIVPYVANKMKEHSAKVGKHKHAKSTEPAVQKQEETNEFRTPQEVLYDSFHEIKDAVYSEILSTILLKNPYEFERLVVNLLQKMGYGGEVKNSGIVTQKSNDGGIDGIIKEDVLGFNLISIQAKRYAEQHHVSREELQRFVGAVAVTSSKKGVFITTSDFTKGARDYVEGLNGQPTIILINGEELAE